jgi:hypothetical protein
MLQSLHYTRVQRCAPLLPYNTHYNGEAEVVACFPRGNTYARVIRKRSTARALSSPPHWRPGHHPARSSTTQQQGSMQQYQRRIEGGMIGRHPVQDGREDNGCMAKDHGTDKADKDRM